MLVPTENHTAPTNNYNPTALLDLVFIINNTSSYTASFLKERAALSRHLQNTIHTSDLETKGVGETPLHTMLKSVW